jgi:hypothetical protein
VSTHRHTSSHIATHNHTSPPIVTHHHTSSHITTYHRTSISDDPCGQSHLPLLPHTSSHITTYTSISDDPRWVATTAYCGPQSPFFIYHTHFPRMRMLYCTCEYLSLRLSTLPHDYHPPWGEGSAYRHYTRVFCAFFSQICSKY